ncbi:Transmembrane protein [Gossypium arboreum]|uniref:Transmembrane protein n=1 Tax=Gossypium arboreum TaxID=29729 RepID=A0A0B0PFB7_GOSAR|nr:Transmembrane protein [Gossypium arboreum]
MEIKDQRSTENVIKKGKGESERGYRVNSRISRCSVPDCNCYYYCYLTVYSEFDRWNTVTIPGVWVGSEYPSRFILSPHGLLHGRVRHMAYTWLALEHDVRPCVPCT